MHESEAVTPRDNRSLLVREDRNFMLPCASRDMLQGVTQGEWDGIRARVERCAARLPRRTPIAGFAAILVGFAFSAVLAALPLFVVDRGAQWRVALACIIAGLWAGTVGLALHSRKRERTEWLRQDLQDALKTMDENVPRNHSGYVLNALTDILTRAGEASFVDVLEQNGVASDMAKRLASGLRASQHADRAEGHGLLTAEGRQDRLAEEQKSDPQ